MMLQQALQQKLSFNPCFNGSMYKNRKSGLKQKNKKIVSILVLMDLCIKTCKTKILSFPRSSFNPCFNGSMYKNTVTKMPNLNIESFNPCFNGSMYKNTSLLFVCRVLAHVSILVLMDLCIKTVYHQKIQYDYLSFNPCFNGSMYKNISIHILFCIMAPVSILVLMDLCIKTSHKQFLILFIYLFQSLF